MINLVIKYGKNFEMQRIRFTIKRLRWYKINGYAPRLPKVLSFSSEKEIKKVIDKEFLEQEYWNLVIGLKIPKKSLEKDMN